MKEKVSMHKKRSYKELEQHILSLENQLKKFEPAVASKTKKKQNLTQLVQSMAIPAFVINNSHIVTHWNTACEKLTNILSSEMVGTRNAWKAFYDHKRPVLADFVIDFDETKKIADYYDTFSKIELVDEGLEAEAFFPFLGDSGKWLYFTATPLLDEAHQVVGAIETFQDITERKNTEEHHRLLLEAIPDPVIVYNPQRDIIFINEAFEETYGWTRKELLGGTIDFVPDFEIKPTKDAWQRTLDGEKIVFETKRKTKNGQLLDIQLRTAILKDHRGNLSASIIIHRDVTTAKHAEREKERLIGILQKALSDVKTLSGLIPICSSCNKIRDDQGYWNKLELYIEKHSEASLSHGICPDCSDKLWGEEKWYIKMKKNKKEND